MAAEAAATSLRTGDHALVGARGEAKPRDWRIGRVVIAQGETVVVEMEDEARVRIRLVAPGDVIAASRSETWLRTLTVARQMLEMRLGPQIAEVMACERRLAAARAALWAGIDAELKVRSPVIDGPVDAGAPTDRAAP